MVPARVGHLIEMECHPSRMPLRTLHAGEGCQRVLACERSHEGFPCEPGGGHAWRERLPQAGLRSSYRRWAARHSLRPHAGRDRSPRDHADTLEQIHSGSDYRSRVTPQYLPIRASTPGKSANRKLNANVIRQLSRTAPRALESPVQGWLTISMTLLLSAISTGNSARNSWSCFPPLHAPT